jgi:hypothetical protein
LPWFVEADGPAANTVRRFLQAPLPDVIDYLEGSLRLVADMLGLAVPITRSSALDIAPDLHGQERVMAIAKARDAAHYVNAPGGRALYDSSRFARAGMTLSFLQPYRGPFVHLLPALLQREPQEIAEDVRSSSATSD